MAEPQEEGAAPSGASEGAAVRVDISEGANERKEAVALKGTSDLVGSIDEGKQQAYEAAHVDGKAELQEAEPKGGEDSVPKQGQQGLSTFEIYQGLSNHPTDSDQRAKFLQGADATTAEQNLDARAAQLAASLLPPMQQSQVTGAQSAQYAAYYDWWSKYYHHYYYYMIYRTPAGTMPPPPPNPWTLPNLGLSRQVPGSAPTFPSPITSPLGSPFKKRKVELATAPSELLPGVLGAPSAVAATFGGVGPAAASSAFDSLGAASAVTASAAAQASSPMRAAQQHAFIASMTAATDGETENAVGFAVDSLAKLYQA
jgi:hypothetical protein